MMMAGTINVMFKRIENHLDKVESLEIGSYQRAAALEKLAKDMPVFLVMAADLAMMVEDLTSSCPQHNHISTDESPDQAQTEDGKGMYL